MSESKNVDYLSYLPPELLQDIFDCVQSLGKAVTGPLSKYLLPFQHRPLYKQVTLTSYGQLDKFCATARSDPELMQYVTKFEIDFEAEFNSEAEDDSEFDVATEVEDYLVPTSSEVRNLFQCLERVESLSIYGSSRLASLILSPEVSSSSFPNIWDLGLVSSFSDFDDPFHPIFYTNLQNYRELQYIFVSALRSRESIRRSTKPLPESGPFETGIFSVGLRGPISSSQVSVKLLLASFGFLTAVSLADFSPSSQIYDLLEGIASPEDLEDLSVTRLQGPPPRGSIVDVFPRFDSLHTLPVGGKCSSLSPTFYSALRTLPIKQLKFIFGADVNLRELEKLISGPNKHTSIETICFNNVEGKMGTRIEEDLGGKFHVAARDFARSGMHPDWEVPRWLENCTRKGLKSFLTSAQKAGVKVEGTAIEAIEISEQYDVELAICRKSRLR